MSSSINYFNDYDSMDQAGPNTSMRSIKEKIKLEFSVENSTGKLIGQVYSVQAKLYANQVYKFYSELKPSPSYGNLTFDSFFICDFFFEREQNLQIILNINNNQQIPINKTLGCIVGSPNSTHKHEYTKNEFLVIKSKKIGEIVDVLNFNFYFKQVNIDKNFFTNNKIFYIVYCNNKILCQSAFVTKNGTIETNKIPINFLLPNYTVTFYMSPNTKLKSFTKTITEVKNEPRKLQFQIPTTNNGQLLLYDNSYISKNYTFLDYIKAGVKIALSIGIDFTGSNGHPLDDGSLHSIKDGKPNDYEKAIISCGSIVGYYDYDQLFPVYGFGAIVNSSGSKEASMCFNLNFEENPDIHTIDNVLKKYHECIEKERLTFSGPTEFTPLIKTVISKIDSNDLFEYHILMILTDGVINDLKPTIDALVEASELPLSVIIVGIGKEDFKDMEILDGDEIPLVSSTGKKRMRDLVQFVPFSKYENDAKKLSMEVLAEIPRQILEFYQFKKLDPPKLKNLMSYHSQMKSNNNYNNQSNINYNNPYQKNNNNNQMYPNNINNTMNNNNNDYFYQSFRNPNSSKNKPNINPVNNQGYQRSNTQRNNYNHHAQYTYPDNVRNNNNNINNNMGVNNNNININNNLPTFEDLQRKNENLFDQLKLDETVYLNKK